MSLLNTTLQIDCLPPARLDSVCLCTFRRKWNAQVSKQTCHGCSYLQPACHIPTCTLRPQGGLLWITVNDISEQRYVPSVCFWKSGGCEHCTQIILHTEREARRSRECYLSPPTITWRTYRGGKKNSRIKRSFVRRSWMPSAPLSTIIMNIAWSFGAKSKETRAAHGCSRLERDGGRNCRWRRRNKRRNVCHSHSSVEDCKVKKIRKKERRQLLWKLCPRWTSNRGEAGRHWWGLDQQRALHMPPVCFRTCIMSPPSCAVPFN